jgi:ribonuclease BN (tRNA processing enzyme)
MILTVLGSGTNLHPARAGACLHLETDVQFIIDFGPRSLTNLLKTEISRHGIEHLFFTHLHADHLAELVPFLFDAVFYSRHLGRRKDLNLYGPRGTARFVRSLLKTFPGFDKGKFGIAVHELKNKPMLLGQTRIISKRVAHVPGLDCLGYRIEYKGRTVAYSGDSEFCSPLIDLCRDADVALLDCSFPNQKPGKGHMTPAEAGRVARQAGVKRLFLTHFYPIAEKFDLLSQCAKVFKGQKRLAKDLMRIKI